MIGALSPRVTAVAAIGLLAAQPVIGQCFPPREPLAPVWQAWMADDPRFQHQYIYFSEDRTELIVRFERRPDPDSLQPNVRRPRLSVFRAKVYDRIKPHVGVSVAPEGTAFLYRYRVANDESARDAISEFYVTVPDGVEEPTPRFDRWRGPVMTPGPPRVPDLLLPWLPLGRSLSWVYDVDKGTPIAPSQVADDFEVRSAYLPGFATARLTTRRSVEWEENEQDPEPWPEDVGRQSDPVLRRLATGCKTLTLAPMFRPGEKSPVVARQLRLAINQLAWVNALATDSPFMTDVLGVLDGIMEGSPPRGPIRSRPGSEREIEIALVLRFSLRIPVPED